MQSVRWLEDFEVQKFINVTEEMRRKLNCRNYYVRYDDESWDVHNPTNWGVIYSRETIKKLMGKDDTTR